MYRYRLVASEPAALDFEHRRETKLKVRDVIEEKGKPSVRVKKIIREPRGWRWLSTGGIAEVELDAPDPETGAISKGIADQQF
jgi:hypothetical protein